MRGFSLSFIGNDRKDWHKKESIKRVLLCSACSIALAFSMVGTAFAYNYQKESSYRYWYVIRLIALITRERTTRWGIIWQIATRG